MSIAAPGTVTLLDDTLPWWPGIANTSEIMGRNIDIEALKTLDMQLVVGAGDLRVSTGGSVTPGSPESADIEIAGTTAPQRLEALHRSLTARGIAARLDIVPAVGHNFAGLLPTIEAFSKSAPHRSRRRDAMTGRAPSSRIITLATFKGGAGKSTLAACLAVFWLGQGRNPALIDADPQHSILDWYEPGALRDPLRIEADATESVGDLATRFARDHRPVIVDTAGFRNPTTVKALSVAQLALIPVKPSPMDIAVALETRRLIDDINHGAAQPVAVRFVLTMTTPGSVIARHIRDKMAEANIPLLKTEIANRVVYGEAALLGKTPTLIEPNGAAAREIAQLADEIDRVTVEDLAEAKM